MRARQYVLSAMTALVLGACSASNGAGAGADASKLDADMEKRAQEIEARADEAAVAAEREATAELTRIETEARSAEAGQQEIAE